MLAWGGRARVGRVLGVAWAMGVRQWYVTDVVLLYCVMLVSAAHLREVLYCTQCHALHYTVTCCAQCSNMLWTVEHLSSI